MKLETILDRMFPGHLDKSLPMFSDLQLTSMVRQTYVVGEDIPDIWAKTKIPDESNDINEILKNLRKENPAILRAFTETALKAYFSNPLVLAPLQNGHVVLFPNAKVLDEIDYDLLIPVIEKYDGKIAP